MLNEFRLLCSFKKDELTNDEPQLLNLLLPIVCAFAALLAFLEWPRVLLVSSYFVSCINKSQLVNN